MKGQYAVEISGLVKSYGPVEALRGLDLRVPRGSLCGFAGVNGAGKTTTLRILLGMARAGAGSASVCGFDVGGEPGSVEIRRRAALVPEQKDLFPYMNVAQVIALTRGFFPSWNESLASRFLREFDLPASRNVSKLSKGMLAKLHLLLALSRGAEVIFLDEPTDGLDPVASEIAMQAMVSAVAESGATVVFCSHRLEEIERVCDHLCLIHDGRTLLDEPLDELRLRTRRVTAVFEDRADDAARELAVGWAPLERDSRSISWLARSGWQQAADQARALGAVSVQADPVSLRELFLSLARRPQGGAQ